MFHSRTVTELSDYFSTFLPILGYMFVKLLLFHCVLRTIVDWDCILHKTKHRSTFLFDRKFGVSECFTGSHKFADV